MADPTDAEVEAAYQSVLADVRKFGTKLTEPEFNQRIIRAVNERRGEGFVGDTTHETDNPRVAFGNRYGDEMAANVKEMGRGALDVVNPMTYIRAAREKEGAARSFAAMPNREGGIRAQAGAEQAQRDAVSAEPIDRQASRAFGGIMAAGVAGPATQKVVGNIRPITAAVGRNLEEIAAPIQPKGLVGSITKKATGALGRVMERAAPETMSPEARMATENLAAQRRAPMQPNTPASATPPDIMERALAEERAARAATTTPNGPPPSGKDLHQFSENVRSATERNVTRGLRAEDARQSAELGSVDENIAAENAQAKLRRTKSATESRQASAAELRADAEWRKQQAAQSDDQLMLNQTLDELVQEPSATPAEPRGETMPSEPDTRVDIRMKPGRKGKPPTPTGASATPPRSEAQMAEQAATPLSPEQTAPARRAWSPETGFGDDELASATIDEMSKDSAPATPVEPVTLPAAAAPEPTKTSPVVEPTPEPTPTHTVPSPAAATDATPWLDPTYPQTYVDYRQMHLDAGSRPLDLAQWAKIQDPTGGTVWTSGYPSGSSGARFARQLKIRNGQLAKAKQPLLDAAEQMDAQAIADWAETQKP